MVAIGNRLDVRSKIVSVLALSSRFDGRCGAGSHSRPLCVSVLALSSRFDGPPGSVIWEGAVVVSVLALSSRFDGLLDTAVSIHPALRFSTRSVESF